MALLWLIIVVSWQFFSVECNGVLSSVFFLCCDQCVAFDVLQSKFVVTVLRAVAVVCVLCWCRHYVSHSVTVDSCLSGVPVSVLSIESFSQISIIIVVENRFEVYVFKNSISIPKFEVENY